MTVPTEKLQNMTSDSVASNSDMMESLKKDNDFFKQMINLVPSNFYLSQDAKDKLNKSRKAVLAADEGKLI